MSLDQLNDLERRFNGPIPQHQLDVAAAGGPGRYRYKMCQRDFDRAMKRVRRARGVGQGVTRILNRGVLRTYGMTEADAHLKRRDAYRSARAHLDVARQAKREMASLRASDWRIDYAASGLKVAAE